MAKLKKYLGREVFRQLAEQRESRIEEGHLMPRPCSHDDLDPTEIRGVSQVIGYIKGKSAIHLGV